MRRRIMALAAVPLLALTAAMWCLRPAHVVPQAPARTTDVEDRLKQRLYAAELRDGPGALADALAALADAVAALGPDHAVCADLAAEAASLSLAQGRSAEARRLFEQAAGDGWRARERGLRLAELERGGPAIAEAHTLYRRARLLLEQGRFLDGWAAAEQARRRHVALLGESSLAAAECALLLGRLALSHSDHYAEAKGLLSQARERLAATLGEDHPSHAVATFWLGTLEEDRGDYFTANQHYQKALAGHEAARGGRCREYAHSLSRQARMQAVWRVSYAEGKQAAASLLREEILGRDHPDFAESLHDHGLAALDSMNFDKAVTLLREALARRRALLGEAHPDVGETLSCLGEALKQKGDMAGSSACHRQSIPLVERACGGGHLRAARALHGYARLLSFQQDNVRSSRLLERERDVRLKAGGGRHPDYAECLGTLGTDLASCLVMNYLTYGDTQLAAGGGQLLGEARRAEKILTEALEVLEGLPDYERLTVYPRVNCLLSLMHYWTDYQLKSRAEVARMVENARASIALHPVSPRLHPIYPFLLVEQAHLAETAGDFAAAEKALAGLREIVEEFYGQEHLFFTTLADLNQVSHYGRTGDWSKLAPAAERAFARLQGMLYLNSLSERASIEWQNILHRPLSEYVLMARRQPGFDTERVYGEVLAFRGAVGRLQTLTRSAHDRPEVRPRLESLRRTRAEFARHALAVPAKPDAAWLESLAQLIDAKEDAEVDFLLDARRDLARPRHDPAGLARTVRQAVPEGGVLVDYVKLKRPLPYVPGQGNYRWKMVLAAFVVRRDQPPALVELGPLEPIKSAVAAWRRDLREGHSRERSSAADVAGLLWTPLASLVAGATTVLIVPDGPACLVPFAALPGARPNSYLVEDVTLGWLPAARSLAEPPAPPKPARGLLAVGGVGYPGKRELPASKSEAEAVLARFSKFGESGELLSRAGATSEALLKSLAARPRVVHFAGHGYFVDPEVNPAGAEGIALGRNALLRSGLVLAGGEVVTAEVLSGVDLRGTDLVTLSACETGLGTAAGGEGVQGLQRAFLNAGARSVLSSLWKVEDAATSLLMEEFYRNLWERGHGKLRALREAQLTVLNQPQRLADHRASRGLQTGQTETLQSSTTPSGRTHPSRWAAFVLSGE